MSPVLQNTRRALVLTGASRGIGHATVKRFASAGWRVITCSRQPFPEENCPWEHGPEDHVQIDLGDIDNLLSGIEEIRTRLAGSPLHALINNAGISPKGPNGERLGSIDTDTALWQQVFQVNFFAPVMLARGLIEELKLGRGTILSVTSIAGGRVHPYAGTAYATSKAAQVAFGRMIAFELAASGIRVNTICPGAIHTEISRNSVSRNLDRIGVTRTSSNGGIPLTQGRGGEPRQVADLVVFLASDASSHITGTEVYIDGGQSLQ